MGGVGRGVKASGTAGVPPASCPTSSGCEEPG
jgi:hypothetical protein